MGNRAIYHDGWIANTTPRNMPWNMPNATGSDTATYAWELYDLNSDFSQSQNVADKYPEKLREMQTLFDDEARKYKVYPLQDEGGRMRGMKMAKQSGEPPRTHFVYWGKDIQSPSGPPIFFTSFSVEADIELHSEADSGVIFAAGSKFGGWSFYLMDGKPVAYTSGSGVALGGAQSKVIGNSALSTGPHHLQFDFAATGKGGILSILVDGEVVGSGPVTHPPKSLAGNGETYDTGRDTNVAVSPDYDKEGPFEGEIRKVEVRVELPAAAGRE
jgi:arylsulfatase